MLILQILSSDGGNQDLLLPPWKRAVQTMQSNPFHSSQCTLQSTSKHEKYVKYAKYHTTQPPSSSKREVFNEPSISWRLHHGCHQSEILDYRLSESPENAFSRTFSSPKLPLESWILYCLWKNFHEYPSDITIWILIIAYSVPQQFSWFKKYKFYWFLNSFLLLFWLMPIQFVPFFDTNILLMMKMVAESNACILFCY